MRRLKSGMLMPSLLSDLNCQRTQVELLALFANLPGIFCALQVRTTLFWVSDEEGALNIIVVVFAVVFDPLLPVITQVVEAD